MSVKVLMLIGVLVYSLYAQTATQKMIVGAYLERENAVNELYKLEELFEKNSALKQLKQTNHLRAEMEELSPYVMVVVKPIASSVLKNRLHVLLQSTFPKIFSVIESKRTKKIALPSVKKEIPKKTQKATMKKHDSFWTQIDSEWIGLILLALAGLLLVARSAKQMGKIKSLQEEMSKYQNKVENEMQGMEQEHA